MLPSLSKDWEIAAKKKQKAISLKSPVNNRLSDFLSVKIIIIFSIKCMYNWYILNLMPPSKFLFFICLFVDIYPTRWKWRTWFYIQNPSGVFRLAKRVQPQFGAQVVWTKYKLMALKIDTKICLPFFLKEDDLAEIQTGETHSKTLEDKTAFQKCFPNIFENIMKANGICCMSCTLWSKYN